MRLKVRLLNLYWFIKVLYLLLCAQFVLWSWSSWVLLRWTRVIIDYPSRGATVTGTVFCRLLQWPSAFHFTTTHSRTVHLEHLSYKGVSWLRNSNPSELLGRFPLNNSHRCHYTLDVCLVASWTNSRFMLPSSTLTGFKTTTRSLLKLDMCGCGCERLELGNGWAAMFLKVLMDKGAYQWVNCGTPSSLHSEKT